MLLRVSKVKSAMRALESKVLLVERAVPWVGWSVLVLLGTKPSVLVDERWRLEYIHDLSCL